jgi:hypothetical protein
MVPQKPQLEFVRQDEKPPQTPASSHISPTVQPLLSLQLLPTVSSSVRGA